MSMRFQPIVLLEGKGLFTSVSSIHCRAALRSLERTGWNSQDRPCIAGSIVVEGSIPHVDNGPFFLWHESGKCFLILQWIATNSPV